MKYLLPFFLVLGVIKGEFLLKIKNAGKEDIDRLAKIEGIDIERAVPDGLLIISDEDVLIKLETMGYEIEKLMDLDSLRRVVLSWEQGASYHTYGEMIQELQELHSQYPDLTKLDTLGYSVQGRLLLAIKISDNASMREPEPEVRIVGTHHGNEWISTEIPLLMAEYLLENYSTDPEVQELVDSREIWIYPMHNPDGHEMVQRRNANNVDLNRDYGYMWDGWGGSPEPYSQPETKALVAFSQQHNFVLSLSYHSYGEIVNYIYNYSPVEPPDSLLVRELSYGYASFNGYWVTEGYNWYQTRGDLNDYSYGIDSDIDWTIELGEEFIPDTSQIIPIFNENKDAILYIIRKAGQGISGFVIDSITGDTIKNARIIVEDIGWPVFTDPVIGDYVRVLLPGIYSVRAEAPGYSPKVVENIEVFTDSLTSLDFYLLPAEEYAGYKLALADVADPNDVFSNLTLPVWALGNPDGLYASIGVGGEFVINMGPNPPAGLFEVSEGDDGEIEGYSVYVSDDFFGPFHFVGNGYGTDTFSIAGTGLTETRFIKIVDDGDGNPNSNTAGFDIDAIRPINIVGPAFSILNTTVLDSSGNNNGVFDPGESGSLFITIFNMGNDTAFNVVGRIEVQDTLITVLDSISSYGTVAPGDSSVGDNFYLVVSSSLSPGTDVAIHLYLEGDNLNDTLSFTMTFGVGGDYLVWDPDPNHSSGPIIKELLDSLGLSGDYTEDLTSFIDILDSYSSLFITCGIYPDNYVISSSSQEALAIVNYIQGGGSCYLEGGDVWYYDPQHGGYNFSPLFGINPLEDGGPDLTTVQGVNGTFTAGLSYQYVGENSWIDHLAPTDGGFSVFENLSPSFICGVAKYDSATGAHTLGVSFEFAGLQDGAYPSTKYYLMLEIGQFFGLPVSVGEVQGFTYTPVIMLYPTVSKGRVFLKLRSRESKEFEITVYDIAGRKIAALFNGRIAGEDKVFDFDLRRLRSGVYFIGVKYGKRFVSKKFVKF